VKSILWLAAAVKDLETIGAYVARDNPTASHRTLLRIASSVDNLADNPGLGRSGRIDGTRELVIADTPYVVAYDVTDQYVRVLTVLHGARKWPSVIDTQ
jgi:addiction module RelE/StbE family toxin